MATDNLNVLVTALAMAIAILAVAFAVWSSLRQGTGHGGWKQKWAVLDAKMTRLESLLGSYPGLIFLWDNHKTDLEQDWGTPKVFGSPAALASMQRFAEPGRAKDIAPRILNGLADLDAISELDEPMTLRAHLRGLEKTGQAFSISIILHEGNVIEADGRIAGRQMALWLEDASIRGEEERQAITRFENQKMLTQEDPVAVIEMMSRAPFPFWRMSSTGRLVWVNEAYVDAVGAKNTEQVTEQQIQLDPDIPEQAKSVLDNQTPSFEIRKMIIGGEHRSTSTQIFPISGGVVGVALDASETGRLEQALTQHIRAHDELLNNMDEAIVIFGANQNMTFHNTAFAKLFKLDETWFSDQPSHGEWLDLLREKNLLPSLAEYRDWKRQELAYYLEWPNEMPDEIWTLPDGTSLRLARMRNPEGGISLLFSDITSSITLQSQYYTQLNVQSATLDKLSEGIAVFGPNGRLKLHNSAFARLWHLSEEDLKDNPSFDGLIEKCMPLYHDKIFWSDLKARTTDPTPEARLHVDGEIRRSDETMLTWLSRPLPDGATLIAWEDVTNSRRAEAALIERAEALEAADRLKSEFVGHVSYQLRTPLTTIAGYADFLQNDGAGELTDKQSEYIFAIQTASEDLRKTIDDILDIAAIEANVLDLELGDVDVYALLDHAMDYVATKAEDTKKYISLDCPEDIGVIRADEQRMKQVVYNLLSNALRYTKPGGNISIGAQRAHNLGVKIWIKDDGVGIPLERQPQVFESFKSSRGGAGLGLALVQRFVERHGGWVELESEEGAGTDVTIYLPREAPAENATPELALDFRNESF